MCNSGHLLRPPRKTPWGMSGFLLGSQLPEEWQITLGWLIKGEAVGFASRVGLCSGGGGGRGLPHGSLLSGPATASSSAFCAVRLLGGDSTEWGLETAVRC